ncbi:MAG: hypothetical protein J6O23_03275 [Prevotella sp.]|nr:hypothetical protein [Prevotella sp.]
MKKLLMVSILLTAAFAAQAQLKVTPQMAKGMEKNYSTEATVNMPGSAAFKMTSDTKVTVIDATADGYTVEMLNTAFTTDAAADNMMGQLMAISEETMKGLAIRLALDKDGNVKQILNYDELKSKTDIMAEKLVGELFKKAPQLQQMMPKDAVLQQIKESVNQESMLRSLQNTTSPLALSGKTIMTGAQDEYVGDQNMKMKRMYFVNGKNVTTNSTMNMSKDDLKKFIIEQVEKMAPEQADMIKQNIDAVIDSGMLKFDMSETATYELQDDGWVKSIKAENKNEAMGQKSVINTVVTLLK